MTEAIAAVLQWLALPQQGLAALFVICTASATLLPVGSEAAVVGLLQLRPDLFWPAVFVATAGNTLGGAINWLMGRGAARAWHARKSTTHKNNPIHHPKDNQKNNIKDNPKQNPHRPQTLQSRHARIARIWLRRWGAKTCLLSWLPVVGDPLCAVAGWLHLPFWPCVLYMAIGKLARYIVMTAGILWILPQW